MFKSRSAKQAKITDVSWRSQATLDADTRMQVRRVRDVRKTKPERVDA